MSVAEAPAVEFSPMSLADSTGRIFWRGGRLFRAVPQERADAVRRLIESRLLEELVEQKLFPRTTLADFALPGFALVLEHEVFRPVTYPYEWSFSMLQEAALVTLRVNRIAHRYGYEITDCHGFNVIFDGARPRFVDLGSFQRRPPDWRGWAAYEEFLRFYCYPLRIWRGGNGYVARRMLLGAALVPTESYLFYRFPPLRWCSVDTVRRAASAYFRFRGLSRFTPAEIRTRIPGATGRVLAWFRERNLLPLQSAPIEALYRRVQSLAPRRYRSEWSSYHDALTAHGSVRHSTSRFERIVALLADAGVRTIVDLGANQGAFSELFVTRVAGASAICIDSDERAVDDMYKRVHANCVPLTPVLCDFVFPLLSARAEFPSERLQADASVALAVTHHLLLTARLSIEVVLRTISAYARKYVCVEFMPLGLYDGRRSPPLPSWYTQDWFREHFMSMFDLLCEEQLEENRVLFFGRIPTKP